MVYKAVESEYGAYIDESGARYEIFEATRVATPQGENVGWDKYDSLDDAMADYKLIYDPIEEERL